MNRVIVSKLSSDVYVITLFNNGRPTITETITGVNNAIIKGNKIAKENKAEYEFKD
jgi:hypothetical protein|tara:strand:+ start:225 stop:392 length:168 start_codon:yes stop_codon:yes gene_type:complete